MFVNLCIKIRKRKIINCGISIGNASFVFFVFFFEDLSTFMGYLKLKPSLKKNKSGTIQPVCVR